LFKTLGPDPSVFALKQEQLFLPIVSPEHCVLRVRGFVGVVPHPPQHTTDDCRFGAGDGDAARLRNDDGFSKWAIDCAVSSEIS